MTDNEKLLESADRWGRLDNVDISNLDLKDAMALLHGPLKDFPKDDAAHQADIHGWTDTVVWPSADKLPKFFYPQKLLEFNKKPKLINDIRAAGLTGKGMAIAIIDQNLKLDHPEYSDRVKFYERINKWPDNDGNYHGSLVAGIAVGKTTGVAPDADLYYISSDNKGAESRVKAIKRIIEINKGLAESEKIRFLSGSFGFGTAKEDREQFAEACKAAEQSGIMILMCGDDRFEKIVSKFNPALSDMGAAARGLGNFGRLVADGKVAIPTDGKTNPYCKGGYLYERLGGFSSTPPYLAGLYACILQNNKIFMTQENWQDKLRDILTATATTTKDGAKIINPGGILQAVNEISRSLLFKGKQTQNS